LTNQDSQFNCQLVQMSVVDLAQAIIQLECLLSSDQKLKVSVLDLFHGSTGFERTISMQFFFSGNKPRPVGTTSAALFSSPLPTGNFGGIPKESPPKRDIDIDNATLSWHQLFEKQIKVPLLDGKKDDSIVVVVVGWLATKVTDWVTHF
jgi:hypothetical protein